MPDYVYRIFDPKTDEIYAAVSIGDTIKEIGEQQGATAAMNFNYANDDDGIPIGLLIVGGEVVNADIPKTLNRDSLYMLPDRTLHIGKPPAGALWSMQGSPPLLENGVDVISAGVERDKTPNDIAKGDNIRTAAGIMADGKLLMLRTYAEMTLKRLAAVMKALGCIDAINCDGGGSSYMWPNDIGYGRKLGAALVVKKGKVKPVTKPVLEIDPGHGGGDPGANGNGMIEKEWTLRISLYQYDRFKELGVPVALTRSTDETLIPSKRVKVVKDSGAKYCISNHLNAATNATAEGAETIHSIHSDGKLANALGQALKASGQPLRRVFCEEDEPGVDYYYMHRETGNVSTVIVEYGFMTNAADAARIKANWKAYAEAVVRAFCAFINHPYSKPEQEPEKPDTGAQEPKSDYEGHPYESFIDEVIKSGIMVGDGKGNFSPDKLMTRGEQAVVVSRLLKEMRRIMYGNSSNH